MNLDPYNCATHDCRPSPSTVGRADTRAHPALAALPWLGVAVTLGVAFYIELGRRTGFSVPVPFLLLYACVVLTANFGGLRVGIASSIVASSFIVYAGLIGFGPSTLTGSALQVALGVALHVLTAVFLGRIKDKNTRLIDEIHLHEETLQSEVRERTRELEASNEALRSSEARFRDFADTAADWYWEMDADLRFSYLSDGYEERSGLPREGTLGKTREELFADQVEGSESWILHFADLAARRPFERFEFPIETSAGLTRVVRISGKPIYAEDGTFLGYRGSGQDVTEARDLTQKLSYQSRHDTLTGLTNRRVFEERLQELLEVAQSDGVQHALCYFDLDQFKVVNDTCGHVAGDELLRELADALSVRVRRTDTLSRLGGDEFGVLMESCSIEQAQRVAEYLQKSIDELRFHWEGRSFNVTASMGLVSLTEDSGTATDVLSMADTACYAAKDAGRNRIHVSRPGDFEVSRRHGEMRWVSRINEALDQNRLLLYYQTIEPLVGDATDALHVELLVRLMSEDGSIVRPGAFLPAVERYALSSRLDRWVADHALAWLGANTSSLPQLALCSFNVSGRSIGDDEFLRSIVVNVEKAGVDPRTLCIEITETEAVSNLARAKRFMEQLQKIGCKFALDDFGIGLSSFNYLRMLPVDYLKIDGSFVRHVVDDPIHLAMVRSINEIGHIMGKKTVGEFAESDAILEKLREIGVDYAQGYGGSIPRPIEELVQGGTITVER